jgi:hypothetical protein
MGAAQLARQASLISQELFIIAAELNILLSHKYCQIINALRHILNISCDQRNIKIDLQHICA